VFEAKAHEQIESFSLDGSSEVGKSGGAAAEPSSAADAGGALESASFRGRKPRRVSMMSYDSQVKFDVSIRFVAVFDRLVTFVRRFCNTNCSKRRQEMLAMRVLEPPLCRVAVWLRVFSHQVNTNALCARIVTAS
jgi:hypothetical protein